MLGGEDNRPNSMGVNGQTGGRSAPTVWNAAFNEVQFWDGRAASLEEQAAGPVTNPIEMGMKSWDDVVVRLESIKGYQNYSLEHLAPILFQKTRQLKRLQLMKEH